MVTDYGNVPAPTLATVTKIDSIEMRLTLRCMIGESDCGFWRLCCRVYDRVTNYEICGLLVRPLVSRLSQAPLFMKFQAIESERLLPLLEEVRLFIAGSVRVAPLPENNSRGTTSCRKLRQRRRPLTAFEADHGFLSSTREHSGRSASHLTDYSTGPQITL